jgi:uncharacterized protein
MIGCLIFSWVRLDRPTGARFYRERETLKRGNAHKNVHWGSASVFASRALRTCLWESADAMRDEEALIVVANSARALSVSAARAGYAPLAVDMFCDSDTREVSLATVAIEGHFAGGLDPGAVTRAVESLIRDYHPIGLVYGSGFEHQPETIASLAQRIRIFGNDAQTLARAKDPSALAEICRALNLRHPEIAAEPPSQLDGWLVKRRGGAGGAHVRPARRGDGRRADTYFERRVAGRAVSALFAADGSRADLIAFSVQWTSPTEEAPFRYGGAAGPVNIERGAAAAITTAIGGVTAELGLKGLNSADFLVSTDGADLVDLNPRPGATLDVFDQIENPLVARHIAACEGRSMGSVGARDVRAAEVVYARREIVVGAEVDWPDWVADRPTTGTRIGGGDPLCTVLAEGGDVEFARTLAEARAQEIIALLRGSIP